MRRRRRPLLRGAMVAGAGYAAGRAGANRANQEAMQEDRLAGLEDQAYQQQAAPPPQATAPGGMTTEKVAQLKNLKELLDSGILSQEEFDAQKNQILAS